MCTSLHDLRFRVPGRGIVLFEFVRVRVSGGREVPEYREVVAKVAS
jgi:hypothetical protein